MARPPAGIVQASLALALVLVLLTAGCRRGEEGFVLLPLVQAKTYTVAGPGEVKDGLTFPKAPEIRTLEIDNERRPVVVTPAVPWHWRGRVPAGGAVLHAGAQVLPEAWQTAHRLEIEITARDGNTREILDVAHSANRRQPQHWVDLDVDLSRWSGRSITLEVAASLPGLPPQDRDRSVIGWSPVLLTSPARSARAETAERPNILFILVDTLRADHLTPYGYSVHDTSPEIQRRLADHGLVLENAYSQAPWTLPSVVSFMTGRYPGELLGEDLATYGIPDGVKPLAERMRDLGYDTGGFYANPTLHAGAGFERGFDTFYAPPADVEWIRKHADELNRHAVPWLRAHQHRQDRPFFLYVHYVDPHDPYENPDMAGGIGGRAQFMPDYRGVIGADWIHGIYSGKLQLQNPAVDIPYIQALYDGEVHYTDRFIGALLDELDPAVLKNTLIVLTADHGEELHDHGGWKHGQSVYDEQIHVPLIFRWDGHMPADKRLPGTVRLLDLVPTLLAAAGGKPDPSWEGTNLLPALTGKEPLPRLAAFSEGMSGGPLRAAAVLEQRKLMLFNREEPFKPADDLQEYLWKKDLGRFARTELYDLQNDAGEHRNLIDEHPDWVSSLQPILHNQLCTELEGLWILPDGLPVGAHLSGSITFERPPERWSPYFLGPADKIELNGGRMRFDLLGDRLTKGVRIKGDFGRVLAVDVALNGKPMPPGAAVKTGAGTPWTGGVTPAGLRSRSWPLASPASPLLRLWMFDSAGAVERRTKADSETEKGLRNLGYVGSKKR